MNYLSVCSGIEAATVAWHPLGWHPVAFSEIEPFPCAVLSHHYPDVPNIGDMTRYKEWNIEQPVDLVVGGTPCQSFSVAGLRKGLDDPRGNLALVFLGLVDSLRPRWVVWENVPGVLSSSGGRDFGAFLGALAELGYGFAYRVLDAQYVRVDGFERAVPQRRRRVFVVGHLGDWRPAAAVLFERDCLCGHPAPSRKAGKGITHDVAPSIGASGRGFERAGETRGQDPIVAFAQSTRDEVRCIGGNGDPQFTLSKAHSHAVITSMRESGHGYLVEDDKAGTLDSNMGMSGQANRPAVIAVQSFDWQSGGDSRGFDFKDTAMLQRCQVPAVAWALQERDAKGSDSSTKDGHLIVQVQWASGGGQIENDTAQAIRAGAEHSYQFIRSNSQVRRLTPIECERLQGFPDNYTNIPWRNKHTTPDSPRYKALGNSMAVNVMRWIGQRIRQVEDILT